MKNKPSKTIQTALEQHIGTRLQKRRLERGLTCMEIDQQIGAKKGMTKAFEEGKRFVGADHLHIFAKALNADVSYLFDDLGQVPGTPACIAPPPDLVESARRLLVSYYKIQDPDVRNSVGNLLKDAAENDPGTDPDRQS